MPVAPTGEQLLATILKHDSKTTSYKFALLRALNDVVLGHPDLALTGELPVAVPLTRLAEWWLAYYWGFADPERPILQGGQDSELPPPVLPLLLHLPTHAAGVGITAKPGLPVVVFDPTQPAQQEYATLADFVASPYGRCTQVYEVSLSRGLDSFTPVFGPGLPHVRPTARLAWEATHGGRAN